mmetsp:Transcript_27372/g.49272  ORF Transcript_27372/g.49272 Transcript_27372/m.49272 type:complete len:852 (+) Transcript_27372:1614-4169(+)
MVSTCGQESTRVLMKLSERFNSKKPPRDVGKNLARRRRKLKPWSDFTQPSQTRAEDEGINERARTWLFSLTQRELQTVFMLKHPWLVAVIRQMYLRKAKEGDCSFMHQDNKADSAEDNSFDSCFVVRPKSQDLLPKNETVPAEVILEEAIRLCDTADYLDTLTLSPEALSNLSGLVECFNVITKSKFLKTPCRAYSDGGKFSVWESPKWFKANKMNSLAYWVVAALEKAVWAAFWEANHLDGRRPNESSQIAYDLPCSYLQDRQVLAEYWKEMSRLRRIEIVGEYSSILDTFKQASKPNWIQVFRPESTILYTNKVNMYEIIVGQVVYYTGEVCTPQRRKIMYYNSEDSVTELYTKLTEGLPEALVDYLYLTPLERSDSQLDAVARKVAYLIKDSHASKLADELLTVEATTTKKLVPKKKKQPKPVKRAGGRSSKSTSESSPSGNEGEHEPCTSQTSQSKTAQLQLDAGVAEEDFVKVDRRKYKKPEGVKKTPTKPNPKKIYKKITSPSFRPKPRPIINPGIVEWQESGTSPAGAVPKIDEFPPLMSPPKVLSESRLSSDIMKFVKDNTARMESLRTSRHILLDKIYATVRRLFPSCYFSLYGSCATLLDLPWSDIDLLITNVKATSIHELVHNLKSLAATLETQEWTESLVVLEKAAVPVIKMKAKMEHAGQMDTVEIDITFDDSGLCERANFGMATTMATLQFLKTYPILRLMVPVLKQLLRSLGYHSSYKGGLSSYTLLLWSIAFLVSRQTPPSDIGEALLQWLEFYGRHFDPKAQAVSVAEGGIVSIPGNPYTYVETRDPVRLSNNTTKGAFAIAEIQQTFTLTARRLRESKHKRPLKELLRNPLHN